VGTSPKFFKSPSTLSFDFQKLFNTPNGNQDVCLELKQDKHIWCHSFILQATAPGLLDLVSIKAEKRYVDPSACCIHAKLPISEDKYYLSLEKEDPIVVEVVIRYCYHFSFDFAVALVDKLQSFVEMCKMNLLAKLLKEKLAHCSHYS